MPVAVFISPQISRASLNLTFCTGLGKPLACKVGVKLSGRLRAGHPHPVLEGPCPAELSLNTNENTPEPANQGLTRQTRIFQAGRLDLVVAKLYRTVALQDRVWTSLAKSVLFALVMPVVGEHSLNKQSRLITCTVKTWS